MSDDEDDYLSDKFLARLEAASKPQEPKSYIERRKQVQKQSQLLNEQNRKKSRKQTELEARQEGLQTSLIQKAQEEAKESGKQNKALAIMMKMGFKPGQSLGGSHEESSSSSSTGGNLESSQTTETSDIAGEHGADAETLIPPSKPRTSVFAMYKHRADPLPIKEWSGKPRNSPQTTYLISDPHHLFLWHLDTCLMNLHLCITTGKTGIGGVKRPPSPGALERAAKMAKQSETLSADEFRDRARREYKDRRAENMLRHARTTCANLDAKTDVKVRTDASVVDKDLFCELPSLVLPLLLPSSIDSGLTQRLRNHSLRGYWRRCKSRRLICPQLFQIQVSWILRNPGKGRELTLERPPF